MNNRQLPTLPLQVPPLENGDRLNRDEFERRYAAMPTLKHAELIEGVVYIPAALRFRSYGRPHGQLITWLGVYEGMTVGDNPTVRLDLDNVPQPDAVLLIEPQCGGQVRVSADDYLEGAPELVAEIAASSATIDLGDKLRAYRRNGVQEYIVWQVFDRRLDWFSFANGTDERVPVEADGVMRSRVFPGLWLAVHALLAGDMAQVLTTLQTGLATAAHAQFVTQLAQQMEGI